MPHSRRNRGDEIADPLGHRTFEIIEIVQLCFDQVMDVPRSALDLFELALPLDLSDSAGTLVRGLFGYDILSQLMPEVVVATGVVACPAQEPHVLVVDEHLELSTDRLQHIHQALFELGAKCLQNDLCLLRSQRVRQLQTDVVHGGKRQVFLKFLPDRLDPFFGFLGGHLVITPNDDAAADCLLDASAQIEEALSEQGEVMTVGLENFVPIQVRTTPESQQPGFSAKLTVEVGEVVGDGSLHRRLGHLHFGFGVVVVPEAGVRQVDLDAARRNRQELLRAPLEHTHGLLLLRMNINRHHEVNDRCSLSIH
jgi:hypothetical protein